MEGPGPRRRRGLGARSRGFGGAAGWGAWPCRQVRSCTLPACSHPGKGREGVCLPGGERSKEGAETSSPPSSPLVEGISASGSRETRYFASEAVLQQRTYFNPVLVAYVLGLAAAFAANTITHKGGACASTRATPNTFAALFLLLGPRSL